MENATSVAAAVYPDAKLLSGNVTTINVEEGQQFVFCNQKRTAFDGLPFPPTHRSQPTGVNWMGDSQEQLTDIYGWTAAAFLIGYVTIFFGSAIMNYLKSWWRGVYTPTGTSYPSEKYVDPLQFCAVV